MTNRRVFLAAGLALSGSAVGACAQPAPAAPPQAAQAYGWARDVILVHGAWGGAAGWSAVADRLWSRGVRSFAPCLTGQGERVHLLNDSVDLTTHVTDIVNEIRARALTDIVLVGHSYGGMVITGVAEQIPERIARIIYVDAFIPADNQSMNEITGDVWPTAPGRPWVTPPMVRTANESPSLSGSTDMATAALAQKLRVTGAYNRIAGKTYIVAVARPSPTPTEIVKRIANDRTWTIVRANTGHGVQREDPDLVASVITRAAMRG